MNPRPVLLVLPSVPAYAMPDGQVLIDRKCHSGLLAYAERWPGRLAATFRLAPPTQTEVRDAIALRTGQQPYRVSLIGPHEALGVEHLAGADVVLAAADDHRQLQVAALCRRLGTRCVYAIEYIPETRHQIVRLENPQALLRWRRQLFVLRSERARRQALRRCHGVQANGVPAHDHYQRIANRLLYFDTRVQRSQLVRPAALEARLAHLAERRPLRLAFSGRLIAMKGADHLAQVAARLRDRGVAAQWTVFGAGELEGALRQQVEQLGLQKLFHLAGAVDFDTALIPTIRREVDAYVMLHRQSDPSCTYLETLACGIPILGYDNRAWRGLLAHDDLGEAVPMDDIDAAAAALQAWSADRARLAERSRRAHAFASEHTLEHTFTRRIDHLRQTLETP